KGLRSKYDSADFVQSVWASFFALPPRPGAFDDPDRLVAFLVQVATHKVVDVVRQRLHTQKHDVRREQPLATESHPHGSYLAGQAPTPSEVAIAREAWDRLTDEEPVDHQVALRLKRDGDTFEEIAEGLGMDERTLR